MLRKILNIKMLRVLTVVLGLYAFTSFGTPKPVEAEICFRGVCGYIGERIGGGCFDTKSWFGCFTVYPEIY